jgi:hypothetical protein
VDIVSAFRKLSTRSDQLQDGSVTIYVQHESPGKALESNWLPAPPDSFNVFMRLYWPIEAILDGTWKMPSVERMP